MLETIFTYLIEDTYQSPFRDEYSSLSVLSTQSKQDLLSCALSCKALFDPAIGILWHTVELFPLMKLLPGFCVLFGDDDCVELYSFTQEVEYNNMTLARFDLYASKVRRLILLDRDNIDDFTTEDIEIPEAIQQRLANARPRPIPFFTHLYCSAAWFLDKMIFMVSPLLKSAHFYVPPVEEIMQLLPILERDAPLLQSMSVDMFRNGDEDCILLISRLKNLRTLVLTLTPVCSISEPLVLDLQALQHLRHLEHLEELTIDLRGTGFHNTSPPIHTGPSSTSLKRLTLFFSLGNATIVASTVMDMFRDSSMEYLAFTSDLEVEHSQTILAQIPSRYTLQPVSSFIAPLYAIQGLETLEVYLSNRFYTSDTDISNICHAWPNLTRLVLATSTTPEDKRRQLPTVAGSIPRLAKSCPRLKELEMTLNVTHLSVIPNPSNELCHYRINDGCNRWSAQGGVYIDRMPTTIYSPDHAHKLELLHLYVDKDDFDVCNQLDGPTVFAYHLDRAFPFLKTVRYTSGEEDSEDSEDSEDDDGYARIAREHAWYGVNGALTLCQEVRRRHGVQL
ncbi:hypothetical protein D9758_005140 [Tetrapyrgos nigripes]|uniref:F-box domain-containing protein n=1 Tax=Tetrapyrgos nigripes TaxID=182062 RepID=A0A8H5GWE2_9AGAR|nr:hypothetical protein D9758_005140 [Tetrapyrgos nigripes]